MPASSPSSPSAPRADGSPHARAPTLGPRYALIAEHDEDAAELFASLVKAHGLHPVIAHDGLTAIARLAERGTPELVLVNISLPAADGFVVLRALRERSPVTLAPAIVLSSNATIRARAVQLDGALGISAVVSPQLSVERLDHVIDEVLVYARRPAEAGAAVLPGAVEPPLGPEVARAREAARLDELEALALVDDDPPPPALQAMLRGGPRRSGT